MKSQKRYPFDTKDDFIKGFYLIAEYVIRYFCRYRDVLIEYQNEIIINAKDCLLKAMKKENRTLEEDLDGVLDQLRKKDFSAVVQEASVNLNLRYNKFKDYEERLSYNYGMLLNAFGDSAGISYRRIRTEYNRRKDKLGLPNLTDLDGIDKALDICLKNRNYVHHFSEPKLLTWRQYREEQVKRFPTMTWPPLDIEINRCEIVNIIFILDIFNGYSKYFDLFSALQFASRNDYCILATGKGCNGEVKINRLNMVDDYSALTISEQGCNLYSE